MVLCAFVLLAAPSAVLAAASPEDSPDVTECPQLDEARARIDLLLNRTYLLVEKLGIDARLPPDEATPGPSGQSGAVATQGAPGANAATGPNEVEQDQSELKQRLLEARDLSIQAIACRPDDYDVAVELSSRLKIVCDAIRQFGSAFANRRLRSEADEVLSAIYFDEENPAAGILYLRGLRAARAYEREEDVAFEDAIGWYQQAERYVFNSARWSERLRAHVSLRKAQHRAAFRGEESEALAEFERGLDDIEDALKRHLLTRHATVAARELYGALVSRLLRAHIRAKRFNEALEDAERRVLGAPFMWRDKHLDALRAAQAALAAFDVAMPEGDEPRSLMAVPPRVRALQELALHFAHHGFRILESRLAAYTSAMSFEQDAEYFIGYMHGVVPTPYVARPSDCAFLLSYEAILPEIEEYRSQRSISNRLRDYFCWQITTKTKGGGP